MNSKLAIFVNSKHLISSNCCQIQKHMRYRLHIPQTPIIEVAYFIPLYKKLYNISIFGCFSKSWVERNLSPHAR